MENIRQSNKVVLGIQLALFALGLVNLGFIIGALLFAMITGAVHVVMACVLIGYEERRAHAQLYLITVALYFVGIFFFIDGLSGPVEIIFSFGVPVLLAIYISYIIHKKEIV
jgi:hypothetical protein